MILSTFPYAYWPLRYFLLKLSVLHFLIGFSALFLSHFSSCFQMSVVIVCLGPSFFVKAVKVGQSSSILPLHSKCSPWGVPTEKLFPPTPGILFGEPLTPIFTLQHFQRIYANSQPHSFGCESVNGERKCRMLDSLF